MMNDVVRVGKYVWEINPANMPMDELKAFSEYTQDCFDRKKQEESEKLLSQMESLIETARKLGWQFTYLDDTIWTNLTTNKDNIGIEIKDEWV